MQMHDLMKEYSLEVRGVPFVLLHHYVYQLCPNDRAPWLPQNDHASLCINMVYPLGVAESAPTNGVL